MQQRKEKVNLLLEQVLEILVDEEHFYGWDHLQVSINAGTVYAREPISGAGGFLVLIAPIIDLGTTGSIHNTGRRGGDATSYQQCASGGGSGGGVVVCICQKKLGNSNIYVSGGAGGACVETQFNNTVWSGKNNPRPGWGGGSGMFRIVNIPDAGNL